MSDLRREEIDRLRRHASHVDGPYQPTQSDLAFMIDSYDLIDFAAMLEQFVAAIAHPDTDELWLRRTLHDEEHAELVEALEEGNIFHIARELADVVYVAFGTALLYGIDLGAALREVHRANMQKASGPRRADGKALKPEGFIEPDMTVAVAAALERGACSMSDECGYCSGELCRTHRTDPCDCDVAERHSSAAYLRSIVDAVENAPHPPVEPGGGFLLEGR